MTVHATEETLNVLKAHIFNWAVWPDFTQLPSPDSPSMRLSPLKLSETIDVDDCRITRIPANHTIPTVGFHLDDDNIGVAYCGDTTSCDSLWSKLNGIANLRCLIIETAFDDSKLRLAERAGHLCPALLAAELEKFRSPADIYISHMKPGLSDTIMREVRKSIKGRSIQKLTRGQVLEF